METNFHWWTSHGNSLTIFIDSMFCSKDRTN